MDYRPLGKTGLRVSVLGFGASPLGDEFGPADFDEGVRAVHLAIDSGINFFDVSPYYGRTLAEERLGRALEGRRDKIILATKCGRYGKGVEECDYSAAGSTGGGPLTLSLSINHGCGGLYHPGDPFVVTYSASANTNLTLIYRRFDGTQFAIFTNKPVIGGQVNTYSATIGNGMGGRTLILDTSPPTPGVQATCGFTIVP